MTQSTTKLDLQDLLDKAQANEGYIPLTFGSWRRSFGLFVILPKKSSVMTMQFLPWTIFSILNRKSYRLA